MLKKIIIISLLAGLAMTLLSGLIQVESNTPTTLYDLCKNQSVCIDVVDDTVHTFKNGFPLQFVSIEDKVAYDSRQININFLSMSLNFVFWSLIAAPLTYLLLNRKKQNK